MEPIGALRLLAKPHEMTQVRSSLF